MEAMTDHPTPDRRRASWHSLDGEWSFAFDDGTVGLDFQWHQSVLATKQCITVPYAYQTRQSGIHRYAQHEVIWYSRTFRHDVDVADSCLLLHFGAVDYEATVWVNGQQVAHHVGGHSPFNVDITHALDADASTDKDHLLVVRCEDYYDQDQPRGKQTWRDDPRGTIWYTATTGIWQTVWLEVVPIVRIDAPSIAIVTDYDAGQVRVEADLVIPGPSLDREVTFEIVVSLRGKFIARTATAIKRGHRVVVTAQVGDSSKEIMWPSETGEEPTPGLNTWVGFEAWHPDRPTLYDLELRLVRANGRQLDVVHSYFGMRKVSIEHGQLCLNGDPFYQKLVLDQGYWPETGLTPPNDAAIRADIELAKACGFNGCRKHQKPETPRWLYHADVLGYLVWGEMADSYGFTPRAVQRMHAEWSSLVRRDLGHPSIVVWLVVNESWGVPSIQTDVRQWDYCASIYHLTKALDATRPAVVSDGWHTIEQSDLVTLHDYSPLERMRTTWPKIDELVRKDGIEIMGARCFAAGHKYRGQPIILSECGGVGVKADTAGKERDFSQSKVASGDHLLEQLERYVDVFRHAQGFCWTQLVDVETEYNGLADVQRSPKVDPAKVKAILAKVQG